MGTKQEYNKKLKQMATMRAAEEIFLKKPYSAISVNEIAEGAGVTKRTLYSYYPSKLALFIQMFENYLQQLHKMILSVAHSSWNRNMIETGVNIIKEGQDQGVFASYDPELFVHLMSAVR